MDDLISRQAAIDAFDCAELTPDGGVDANDALEILEKLPSVQPTQRWTPCSEGLPAPKEKYGKKWSEYVLVFGIGLSGTRGVAISQYYYDLDEQKESGWAEAYMYIDSGIMKEIIAWMPLPEPYKGGPQNEKC